MSFSPMNIPPQNPDLGEGKRWYKRGWMWLLAIAVLVGVLISR